MSSGPLAHNRQAWPKLEPLREQPDARMRAVLVEASSRFSLIIVGYSGRDASVMQALRDALERDGAFPGGIYWVTQSPTGILPAVREFLETATAKKVATHIVQSQNFDEFAGDIADVVSFEALYGPVKNLGYPFNEGVRIRLDQGVGQWWCVFDPYTNVDLPIEAEKEGSSEPSMDEPRSYQWKPNPAADWLRERWAQRYNKKWSAIINAWSSLLRGEARAFWLEEGEGIDAIFQIGAVTAWSRPSHDHAYFHGAR